MFCIFYKGNCKLFTGPFVPGIVDVMLDYKKEAPFFRMYYPTAEKFDMQVSTDILLFYNRKLFFIDSYT